jgi:hypothetical protein
MYFRDDWSFVVETEKGTVYLVDLQEEDDWGDIEPVRRDNGLACTIGKKDNPRDEVLDITRVWEYREDGFLNNKLAQCHPIGLDAFVRRLLDAAFAFHGETEDRCQELKEYYGV